MPKRFLGICVLAAGFLGAQTSLPRSWADADKQEADLAARPDDTNLRNNLLHYYFANGQQSPDRVKAVRRKHILWFIEHHPENQALSDPAAVVDKAGTPYPDPDGFAEADALWKKALSAEKPLPDTFANASVFYRVSDPARAREVADEGLRRYPGHFGILERKGRLLADSIVGAKTFDQYGRATAFDETRATSPEAARDRQTLETSDQTGLLLGAAMSLTQEAYYLKAKNMTPRLQDVEDLTVRLYRRAMAVDPNSTMWPTNLVSAYQTFAMVASATAEKLALLEKALALATDIRRYDVLLAIAPVYLDAGNTAKAAEAANELLNAPSDRYRNYGSAVVTGNNVLGLIALKEGDRKGAARRLLAVGRAPSTPMLVSYGPTDWRLAEGLLATGDRDSVLSYLDLLRDTWKSGAGKLDTFTETIRSGGAPNFTGPPQFQKSRFVGRPAPDFRLKDLHGAEVALSEFKGKIVIVDFWATWCPPCRAEMPDFQKIHRDLSSKDVVVLTVDVNETREVAAEYIAKEKFTFPVLLAKDTRVMDSYGVHAYPTTFFVDKNGLVADVAEGGGPDSGPRLQALIAKARAGAPPAGPEPPPVVSTTRTASPAAPPAPVPSAVTADDFYRDATRQHGARDYNGALRSIDRALELHPNWLPAINTRADIQFHERQYDDSIATWTKSIELDPKRAASYQGRALAYSNSGRHAQALPDYSRAIELQPDFVSAYSNRSWAYRELGRTDEAMADLAKALDLNPSYTAALFSRAYILEKSKEWKSAVADLDRVLRADPANAEAARRKANDLRMLQDSAPPAAGLVAPRLLSPAPGEVLEHYPRDTTVVWSEVPGAAGYMVEWDYEDNAGWVSERNGGAVSLRADIPVAHFSFVGAQTGRWRVWALDANGVPGPKTDWRVFRYTK